VLADPPGIYAAWKRLIIQYAVLGVRVHDARLATACRVGRIPTAACPR
jgi:hypothetical protein